MTAVAPAKCDMAHNSGTKRWLIIKNYWRNCDIFKYCLLSLLLIQLLSLIVMPTVMKTGGVLSYSGMESIVNNICEEMKLICTPEIFHQQKFLCCIKKISTFAKNAVNGSCSWVNNSYICNAVSQSNGLVLLLINVRSLYNGSLKCLSYF